MEEIYSLDEASLEDLRCVVSSFLFSFSLPLRTKPHSGGGALPIISYTGKVLPERGTFQASGI